MKLKKRICLILAGIILLLLLLFLPIPSGSYDDGGTEEWNALTYRTVIWNRLTEEGDIHHETRIFFFPDRSKSIDDLWLEELPYVESAFIGRVLELSDSVILVEPILGEAERRSGDRFAISREVLSDKEVQIDDLLEIRYTGGIMETYPASIIVSKCLPVEKDLLENPSLPQVITIDSDEWAFGVRFEIPGEWDCELQAISDEPGAGGAPYSVQRTDAFVRRPGEEEECLVIATHYFGYANSVTSHREECLFNGLEAIHGFRDQHEVYALTGEYDGCVVLMDPDVATSLEDVLSTIQFQNWKNR